MTYINDKCFISYQGIDSIVFDFLRFVEMIYTRLSVCFEILHFRLNKYSEDRI